jgi:hypothetical protein
VGVGAMKRFERCECGRWKATEDQFHRWFTWCQLEGWRSRLTAPLWWRLSTRCLQWHDCDAAYGPGAPIKDYPLHVRILFRIPKRARL